MQSTPTYVHLPSGSTPPSLAAIRPFLAVVIAEQAVSPEWQARISDWLVQSGCLYMLAWGQDCSSWDDSVDWASLRVFDYGDIPDDRFVMTTWHTDDSLIEVFEYAKNSARHPSVELTQTVLVHIAANASEQAMLQTHHEA